MILISDAFPDYSCEVTIEPQSGIHIRQLIYKDSAQGEFSGYDMASVKAKFDTIADCKSRGAIVRHGIIIGTWVRDEYD